MDTAPEVEDFWREYLDSRSPDDSTPDRYDDAFSFGDSPEMADTLAELVVNGTKTVTATPLWECERDDERHPEVGDHSVVLDGEGTPRCVVETTAVETVPFDEVGEEFVRGEGDGIRTVEDWRNVHWEYWSRTLPEIGRTPSESMPVVCERFRVVYSPSTQ